MKRTTTIATSLATALIGVMGLADLAQSRTIDAVSSASGKLRITGGSTTVSSATLNFTFQYSGTSRLYYDVANHNTISAFPKYVQTSTKTFNVTNLVSGTKYYYWVQIVDPSGSEPNANAHSSLTVFTTEGPTAVQPRTGSKEPGATGVTTDPLGRRNSSREVQIGPHGVSIDLTNGHR